MTHCLHGNTTRHSVTLQIDKCNLCGRFLVWCDLDHSLSKDLRCETRYRHTHTVDNSGESLALRRAIETTTNKRAMRELFDSLNLLPRDA